MATPTAPYRPHQATSPLGAFPDFSARVLERLNRDRRINGTGSYDASHAQSLQVVEDKLLELTASVFVLWMKVRELSPVLAPDMSPALSESQRG